MSEVVVFDFLFSKLLMSVVDFLHVWVSNQFYHFAFPEGNTQATLQSTAANVSRIGGVSNIEQVYSAMLNNHK